MEFLTQEQLDNITNYSIPFPLFFAKNEDMEQIIQVLTIVDVGPTNLMGVPEYVELEKHNSSGMITAARYALVDSYKAHESKFENAPEDN